MMEYDIESVASNFTLDGRLIKSEPFGSGHINDTFRLTCRRTTERTVLYCSGSITTYSKIPLL